MNGERNHGRYRTLISGVLEQTSGLSVGAGASLWESDTACCRDGQGRLTIPGSGLAGALVETTARLFPRLLAEPDRKRLLGQRVTGKELDGVQRREDEAGLDLFQQSVWRVANSHPIGKPDTEWRQGAGIRQATGASAGEKRALYDFEFVPVGIRWEFFLEIDTFRGNADAEALAVLALQEWVVGRCWLGRSAARGTGWIRLLQDELLRVLRPDRRPEHVACWPNNTKELSEQLQELTSAGVQPCPWDEALKEARDLAEQRRAEGEPWEGGQWPYLSLPRVLEVGRRENGYGSDPLEIGGHPALGLTSDQATPVRPLSIAAGGEVGDAHGDARNVWPGAEYRAPDKPFVTTRPASIANERPYIPGGGLRGPLRHTASRLARARREEIRDPNWKDDPLAANLRKQRQSGLAASSEDIRGLVDSVTALFGAEELGGRILVRDAGLARSEFRLVRAEHHAEDEFTGGVYGGSKFDANALVEGRLAFEMIIEAPSQRNSIS